MPKPIYWWSLALVWLITACQTTPTKVYETSTADILPLIKGAREPLTIDSDTVVLDARIPFDFAMAHIPGAINIQWQEFTQSRGAYPGLLQKDLFALTRRLARLGITTDSKVVVVGPGPTGQGEEGRLAWTLYYLGIKNVHFASLSYFKTRLTNEQNSPPREPATIWKPRVRSSVMATRDEVLKAIASPGEIKLIDVRSHQEYFKKQGLGLGYSEPDLQALNIEWKEFFTPDGRPNLAIRERLMGVGIKPKDRVILISNQGVRSAAVTMALLAMGYEGAANYAGGFKELVSQKKAKF